MKDVLIHYWYAVQCKLYGFIKNGKVEGIVANVVIRALEIHDEYVLICEDEDVAYVASKTNFLTIWLVISSNTDWAQCNCPMGMRGNICKHVVKVFRMLNTKVEPGDIIKYVGSLRGTIQAAYPYVELDAFATIPVAESGYNKQEQIVKVKDTEKTLSSIRTILHEIEAMAVENMDLRHHVLAALHESKGRIASLKVKADAELMHPLSQPSFQVGPGPTNLRRFKACSETGDKRRGTRGTLQSYLA